RAADGASVVRVHRFARFSRRHGYRHRCATKQLAEEVHSRPPVLPARSPYRHQDRLRPRTCPGSVAAPDLAEDYAETDSQLRTPVGGVQPWTPQERKELVAMIPQVLGQAFVGSVRLG